MICVPCNQPNDPGWKNWQKRAIAKLDEWRQLAMAGKPTIVDNDGKRTNAVNISDRFYKARKTNIFERFGNRCAYCEALIHGLDQPGDVEHYRPKLKVETLVALGPGAEAKMTLVRKMEQGEETLVRKTVEVDFSDGSRGPHPGYYWLAYDWANLLLACSTCNTAHYNEKGHYVGKGMVFPVEGGANSLNPAALEAEKPLLINPNQDDPSDDLELEGETGVLSPRRLKDGTLSIRGSTTIALLDLNRTELVAERKRAYHHFRRTLRVFFDSLQDDPASAARSFEKEEIDKFLAKRLPYMLALQTAYWKVITRHGLWIAQIQLPENRRSKPDQAA